MFPNPANVLSRRWPGFCSLAAPVLVYRATFLIWTGHAARYVLWLRALTWVELALAAVIAGDGCLWLVSGARRLACAGPCASRRRIIVLHAARVAVFARRGRPLDRFRCPSRHRPVDPRRGLVRDLVCRRHDCAFARGACWRAGLGAVRGTRALAIAGARGRLGRATEAPCRYLTARDILAKLV